MGFGEIIIRRIHRIYFLIERPDNELMEILKQNDRSYLKEIFTRIEPCSEKITMKKRISWVEIFEVSLHC